MKENLGKNNKLIISHIADVDGMSSVILAKAHFENIDYCLVEFSELETIIKKLINEKLYLQYDEIFITDVSFRTSTLELVDSCEELKRRIKHFDHHASEVDVAKKYSFVNEVIDRDGKKVCGTTLFYDYIKDDFKYKSEYLDKYLEAVRSYDTMGPLCGNDYGNNLTTLFGLIGIDNFINKFTNGIKSKQDPLNEDDMALINRELEARKDYVDLCDKNLIRIELDNYNVGVSISEQYRSVVGNDLSQKYQDELDYILIINFMRNQFSFRTVKNDVNVGELAKKYSKDGGGHPKAAGMPIDKDTLFILDLVKEGIKKKQENLLLTKKQS